MIVFTTDNGDYLNIIIKNKKYLDIYYHTYENYKSKKLIKKFKIINGEINMNLINSIFEELNSSSVMN